MVQISKQIDSIGRAKTEGGLGRVSSLFRYYRASDYAHRFIKWTSGSGYSITPCLVTLYDKVKTDRNYKIKKAKDNRMTLRWDLDWIYHFEAAMIDKLLKFAFPSRTTWV